jgi:c(7)-type cytochrome triheme protein
MSRVLLFVVLIACLGCGGSSPTSEEKAAAPAVPAKIIASPAAPGEPPDTITFPSSYGTVVFTHKQHFERVNNDCATCHPKLFPQALEPLDYGKSRHRVAEEYKTSCAACHDISGAAFAAERNCQRCHDMSTKR